MTKNATPASRSPGEHLQRILDDRRMKNAELAELLGRSAQYITDIIKGKKAMDVDLAIQLEQVLGGTPTAQQWMIYAIEYRLSSSALTRLDVIGKYQDRYAKELIKLKWIDGKQSPTELDRALSEFWELEKKVVDFKQSQGKERSVNDVARNAWAIQVYRRAMALGCPEYDETRLPELMEKLQSLMGRDDLVTHVPGLIRSYGIRFVVLTNPPKCPVDGVASYNEGCPYMGISLRIARLDSFWFVIMHELMHIMNKDSQNAADTIDRLSDNPKETKANFMARNYILPDDRYDSFVKRGVFTFSAIKAETERGDYKIDPSILLGRLKNDLILDWSQFAREHPGIRHYLSSEAA